MSEDNETPCRQLMHSFGDEEQMLLDHLGEDSDLGATKDESGSIILSEGWEEMTQKAKSRLLVKVSQN